MTSIFWIIENEETEDNDDILFYIGSEEKEAPHSGFETKAGGKVRPLNTLFFLLEKMIGMRIEHALAVYFFMNKYKKKKKRNLLDKIGTCEKKAE
jgi:hypothetical protein